MIPLLIKSFRAAAVILPCRIVAFSEASTSSMVSTAAAASDPLAGTTGKLGATAGNLADILVIGEGEVQLGGVVAAGTPLTSNAVGKAVVATVAGQRIIGFAGAPGVADDIIPYIAAPGFKGA